MSNTYRLFLLCRVLAMMYTERVNHFLHLVFEVFTFIFFPGLKILISKFKLWNVLNLGTAGVIFTAQ